MGAQCKDETLNPEVLNQNSKSRYLMKTQWTPKVRRLTRPVYFKFWIENRNEGVRTGKAVGTDGIKIEPIKGFPHQWR